MADRTKRSSGDRQDRVAAYKTLLRQCIDQRPSGARLRIARVLGTHKSFISQITNPADPTPIPARHLAPIFEVCHLSEQERARFLEAYGVAHPRQSESLKTAEDIHYKTLHLDVPLLDDPQAQQELEEMIRDFARQSSNLLASALHRRDGKKSR